LLLRGMPSPTTNPLDAHEWRAQELLLMREVMRLAGRSLSPQRILREMLHLMSELLGLNRRRIVLADPAPAGKDAMRTASIQHAYGLTVEEVRRGRYAWRALHRAVPAGRAIGAAAPGRARLPDDVAGAAAGARIPLRRHRHAGAQAPAQGIARLSTPELPK
jgi:GAF domain-containing protein